MAFVSRTPLVLALAATVWLGACTGERPDDLLASAKSYIAKNDNGAAVIQLKNALQKQPDLAEARFLLGKVTLQSGDAPNAGVDLKRAISLGYPKEEALPLLLRAMLAEGRAQDVIRDYADTTLATPEADAELKTLLATAYGATGQFAKSQAAIDAALKAQPTSTPARLFQARLLGEQGRADDALALLAQVAQADPQNAEVWMHKGEVLWHGKGDLDGAAAAYREAITRNPRLAVAHTGLAGLLLARNDLAAAATEIDALRNLPGQRLTAMYFEAQSAFQSGNTARAYEVVQQVLKASPNSASALQLAGSIELQNRSLLAAERSLTKALQLAPELTYARRLLAQTYLRAGQPDKALTTLGPLLSVPKPSNSALSLAGEAYLQDNQPAKAEAAFKQALAADPGSTRNRTALALLQLDKNKSEAVMSDLQSLAANDPGTYADMALITLHMRSNNTAKALAAIDKLAAKQPGKPEPAYLRGTVQLNAGNVAKAREAFEAAVAADPGYMSAVMQLVSLDVAERNFKQAHERLDKVLAADKRNVTALLALSMLREREGAKPKDVLAPLQQAVAANPSDTTARLRLIDHYLLRKDTKQALEAAQQAVGAQPASTELLDALGRTQVAARDTEQAVSTFNKLAALAPQTPQPYQRLAAIALSQGNLDLASRHLKRAISITPNLVAAQQMLMGIELQNKRYPEALEIARTVQKQRPKELTGFMWEADIQASRTDAAGAVDIYRTLFKRFERTDPLVKLHTALMELKRVPEADALTKQWLAAHPNDLAYHLYLGDVALARQDFAGAADRFAFVVKLQPDNVAALNNLAWATARQGKPGGVALARKAVSLRPDLPTLMDTLAFTLAAENKFDEAIDTQKKAMALSPDGGNALRLGLARLYMQAGKNDAARAELQTLAGLGDKFDGQAEVKRMLGKL